jgi:hypothetical protein
MVTIESSMAREWQWTALTNTQLIFYSRRRAPSCVLLTLRIPCYQWGKRGVSFLLRTLLVLIVSEGERSQLSVAITWCTLLLEEARIKLSVVLIQCTSLPKKEKIKLSVTITKMYLVTGGG